MSKFLILARCLRQTQFAPPAFPKRHIVAVSKDPWVHLLYLKKRVMPQNKAVKNGRGILLAYMQAHAVKGRVKCI